MTETWMVSRVGFCSAGTSVGWAGAGEDEALA